MIKLDKVTFGYDGRQTLDEVSAVIDRGSFHFLTGPSGAGKTTLMKLLYLQHLPSSGRFRLFGDNPATLDHVGIARVRRRIGVVFQEFRLLDHLTVIDNIAMPLRAAGVRVTEHSEDVMELVRWVGLEDRAGALPPQLSAGEKQRAAIARAGRQLAGPDPGGRADRQYRPGNGRQDIASADRAEQARPDGVGRDARSQPDQIDEIAGRGAHIALGRWPAGPGNHCTVSAEDNRGSQVRPVKRPDILPRTGWAAPLTALISAAMTFLGVLTVGAALAAGGIAAEWRSDLDGVATVRVSALSGDIDGRIDAVLEVLRTTPGIAKVRVVTEAEQAALLSPWIGSALDLGDFPTPRLIDITIEGEGPDRGQLQARLDLTVQGAIYDDHAAWRTPLATAANALERLALGATFLVLLTSVGMVAFAARVTLIAHRDVIQTIRLMGAEDSFLTGAFVRGLTRRAILGGLVGTLLACVVILLLPGVDSDPALAHALDPGWSGWVLMVVGVPGLGALAAWLTARWAVRAVLRQMT